MLLVFEDMTMTINENICTYSLVSCHSCWNHVGTLKHKSRDIRTLVDQEPVEASCVGLPFVCGVGDALDGSFSSSQLLGIS